MSSNPLRLKYLLEKYLDNRCTRKELSEFWKLMSELSENDLISLDLQQLWHNDRVTNLQSETVDWDKAYHRFLQKIETREYDYVRPLRTKRRNIIRLAVAASLLLFTVLSWWWVGNLVRMKKKDPAPVVAATVGHQVINLPDGTIVTLNASSKLDYPAAFKGPHRDVYLTGEAYFDVKHDPQKLFLVHTGNIVTQVLGTSFNIKAYSGDERISVTVANGKVLVKRTGDKEALGILLPGDQLQVDRSSVVGTLAKVDVKKVLSWVKENLEFDNTSFDEAALLLSNHFGVELRFEKEALRNCRFTGDFTNNSLEQTLDIICALTKSSWRRESEKRILISGNGCN